MAKKIKTALNAVKTSFFLRPVLIFILGLPAVSLVSYNLALSGKIFPNVFVCQYNLGGKSQVAAERILTNLHSFKLTSKKLNFIFQDKSWEINLEDFGFQIDFKGSCQKAYQIGRQGNFVKKIGKRLTLLGRPEKISFEYRIDQGKLEERLASISNEIYIPAVNPQIKIIKDSAGKKQINIDLGKNGVEVDQRKLSGLISQKLVCLDFTSLQIPAVSLLPTLTWEEKENLALRGRKILDKTLKINLKDQSWTLKDEDLIGFLSPKGGFAEEKINEYIENLRDLVESDPQNATFKFGQGRVTVFKPARQGVLLDRKKTKEKFISALTDLENQTNLLTQNLEISVSLIPPKIKNEDVNNLGIIEVIGIGRSKFKGSASERIHNISLAASKLDGLVLEPGETFSFNQALGDVSEQTGFKKAYIIKEGRTILGDGGGVCQVSTTLFRAILNAGLPIEERHPHAYRVSYYEQDSQPGLDATVFAPSVDLKFKNDTPAYILIQSEVNLKNKSLIFTLYGTTDGRRAEIGKSYVWDIIPPPPDLYQDDPTLPAGIIKQVDWKAWGAKVRFSWKVTRGEEILQEKTFYSQYRPWQAIYLRGTKTNL